MRNAALSHWTCLHIIDPAHLLSPLHSLRDNNIGAEGIAAIEEARKHNTTLVTFDHKKIVVIDPRDGLP